MGAEQSAHSTDQPQHHQDPFQDHFQDTFQDDPWWGSNETQSGPAASSKERDDALQSLLRRVEELTQELGRERQERRQHWREVVRTLADGEPPREDDAVLQLSEPRRQELAMLRAQLSAHREARRAKLEAVSTERERLRAELAAERALRQQLEQERAEQAHQSDEPTWDDALLVESEQLREDLQRERDARQQLARQVQQLQARCEQLQMALDAADSDARRERDAAGRARQDTARVEVAAQQVAEDLARTREEAERVTTELTEVQRQANALKEVAAISKRMLAIREEQVRDMRTELSAIEEKVGKPEGSTTMANLRAEYEKQITNIRDLKKLYEERARVLQLEKDKQATELEQRDHEAAELREEIRELKEKTAVLETTLGERSDTIEELEFQLGDSVAECQNLTNQMARINGLFTQMLTGCQSDIDLDRLVHLLHENHDLIADITAKGGGSDIAPVLPKLILDLITQVENEARSKAAAEQQEGQDGEEVEKQDGVQEEQDPEQDTAEDQGDRAAASGNEELVNEIASNLPKVWAVLRELVSQQVGRGVRRGSVGDSEKGKSSCYTSVNTPGGPRRCISVSKTYIRLKDLIVEKRSLQRELGSLKQLNGHLETRLDEQESRLSQVSSELHKTWGLVGRLQAQHQQLHTHEKILRYELHQKRELLSELKQELEYCREKWESAREKNSQTDREWRLLRREFAARKARDATRLDDLNNSGESGLGEDSGEDDIDSSGRSESPSVTEDPPGLALSPTSTHSEEDLVSAAADLPVDPSPEDTSSSSSTPTTDLASVDHKSLELTSNLPTSTDPTSTDPTSTDPTSTNPTSTDPTSTDPTSTDPTSTDPTSTDPTSTDPTSTDPTPTDPTATYPTSTDPTCSTEHTSTDPTSTDPTATYPTSTDPTCSTEHASTNPDTADATSLDLPSTEHISSNATTTERVPDDAVPIQVPLLLEHTDVEVLSLDLSTVPTVTSSACVVMTEPLPTYTVVQSAAVVLETEVVQEAEEDSDGTAPRDPAKDLTDLKARALLTYNQRVASLRQEAVEEVRQDTPGDILEEEQVQDDSLQADEAVPDTRQTKVSPLSILQDTRQDTPQDTPPETPDTPQDTALRPPPTRVVPLFGALAPQVSSSTTPLLFSSFDIKALDFNCDVTTSLVPSVETPEQDATQSHPSPTEMTPATETPRLQRSPEEILANRAARLQRLEQQTDWLKKKMARTSERGTALATKLEELHEQYGPASASNAASSAGTSSASPMTPTTDSTSVASAKASSGSSTPTSSRASPTASSMAPSTDSASATISRASPADSSVAACKERATSSPAPTATPPPPQRTPEEILAARAERLSRLEAQCSSLFTQMNRTSHIGNVLSTRLGELHEQYGGDAPPTPTPPATLPPDPSSGPPEGDPEE